MPISAQELARMMDATLTTTTAGVKEMEDLIAFAREELGLTRLVAHCDARNLASARVMEAIGLTLEDDAGHRLYPKTGEEARELTYSLALR